MYSNQKRELCTTIRPGYPCIFMKKHTGCNFNFNYCLPIVPNCKEKEKLCNYVITLSKDKEYCTAYMNPAGQWEHLKKCPLETHLPKESEKKKEVLDPRKAAKQRRRKG